MTPRSKADRLVLTERLVEAGLASDPGSRDVRQDSGRSGGRRSQWTAHRLPCPASHPDQELCGPSRSAEIWSISMAVGGSTFRPGTPSPTESISVRYPSSLRDRLTGTSRSIVRSFAGMTLTQTALWVLVHHRPPLTTKNLGTLISKLTRETIGVDVSPHCSEPPRASTAALYAGNTPLVLHRHCSDIVTRVSSKITTIAPWISPPAMNMRASRRCTGSNGLQAHNGLVEGSSPRRTTTQSDANRRFPVSDK